MEKLSILIGQKKVALAETESTLRGQSWDIALKKRPGPDERLKSKKKRLEKDILDLFQRRELVGTARYGHLAEPEQIAKARAVWNAEREHLSHVASAAKRKERILFKAAQASNVFGLASTLIPVAGHAMGGVLGLAGATLNAGGMGQRIHRKAILEPQLQRLADRTWSLLSPLQQAGIEQICANTCVGCTNFQSDSGSELSQTGSQTGYQWGSRLWHKAEKLARGASRTLSVGSAFLSPLAHLTPIGMSAGLLASGMQARRRASPEYLRCRDERESCEKCYSEEVQSALRGSVP